MNKLEINIYLDALYDAVIKTERAIGWSLDENPKQLKKAHSILQQLYFAEVEKYEDVR